MCTRDRVKDPFEIAILRRGGVLIGEVAAQLPDLVRAGLTAVSYTHLRAHETVLDIVCRLLLEKNK